MKKFFTLVLMLFASLQLFANAEIVIYNNSTGTTIGSDFTISSNNFKNIVEEGDNIVVTVKDYTRVGDAYPYFQIEWGDWEGWKNLGTELSNGENVVPLTAADVTKINASQTYGINFRTNGTTSYTITKVVLRKNDNYSDFETVTLNENTNNEGTYFQKVYSDNAYALRMSDGDLLVVVGKSDENSGGSWSMRELSKWDNVYSTGSFDGRDYAYIIASGKGSRIHEDGFQFVTNKEMSAVKIAKKIYSLSEASDFDFSSVVTGSPVKVKLSRTITAGNWSTIVLPFDLPSSEITTVFGPGASVAEFTGGDESTLRFEATLTGDKMSANQPYAIKVSSDFSTATISDVTIVSATPTQSATNWDFVGNYTAGETIPVGSYYFKDNALHKATNEHSKINGFRAYFTYKGGSTPTLAPSLNFVIDGTITGIKTVTDNEESTNNKFYNLSGQQIEKPTKGIYIKNGKKYIIK